MTDLSTSEVGRVIAHYTVEGVLGRGSAGVVYLARDLRINRLVALKSIDVASQRFEDARDADEFFQRLQREVEVCGGLNHPNLVTLYDAGYEGGHVSWLALEYVDGSSLLELMRAARPNPLPIDRIFAIASDVLRGLAFAHEKGVVHRDIKPANILVGTEGVAKIADFGIARPSESLMTVAGTLMGTPNYMSPEQVKGLTATAQSDLFSFGGMLYEMLSTRKAFGASDISGVLYNIVHREHPRLEGPGVTPELADLLDRLLAKAPEARPSSAREVLETIERLRTSVSAAPPPPVLEPDAEITERSDPPATSAIMEVPALWKDVPKGIAGAIVAGAALAFLVTVIALVAQIDSTPTVSIPEETLREFAQKRETLAAADALCDDGKLSECIAAYDAYLARYPWARAAQEARAEAARLEQESRRGGTVESTKSGWQRFKGKVKRVFGKD